MKEDERSYSWININITLFDRENKDVRAKFKNELKKPRNLDIETTKKQVEFLFETYTGVAREGNEDCFMESIADTDANVTYPLISEKLKDDKTEKGQKKRLFAVKVLGRLALLNLENKDVVSKIIAELNRVHQKDEDTKITIEAGNQRNNIIKTR